MEIYYTGVIIAISTFVIIGIFHPIVMKTEYYTGIRFWWIFLVAGILCIGAGVKYNVNKNFSIGINVEGVCKRSGR